MVLKTILNEFQYMRFWLLYKAGKAQEGIDFHTIERNDALGILKDLERREGTPSPDTRQADGQ